MTDGATVTNGEQPHQEPDRAAEPVDTEQPPRLPFPVVGIGASAGGLAAFIEFFSQMPPDSGMAFVLIQHLPPDRESLVAEILSKKTQMPVRQVEDGMDVEANHAYVIRPGHTLTISDGKLRLGEPLDKPRHSRPVDDFFKSLAEEQRERAICVIMSGMGSNGSAGAQAVKAVGGICIAQEPESAEFPSMPRHLIDAGYADYILRPRDIPAVLLSYADHPYTREHQSADAALRQDKAELREILAVLRTRTQHDFTGYKKPTVLRRVHRRMGLSRLTKMADYARLLRQSPTEVSALKDDLLIHVTGFFRDAGAWEALREQVIVPLVASRDADATVRCWVTACSSGEEAYSLTMLLVEECERVNKPLDIKVFATDTAERTLSNARNGIYPGGIEAEMSHTRLDRFFQKEDAVYRIRQDVRERVVFAPQNVLQDPPFSRLDIVTCRNLLIYLEPELQKRVLSLVHFGLRDGGALFLGTSETIGGVEELYQPIDKKARIFRRIGHARRGLAEFPLPRSLSARTARASTRPPNVSRPSVAQLTSKALLERHVPAAVTVDRDHRVVYFHGNVERFLVHPAGEATRDVLELARDSVRPALRAVLLRAESEGGTATQESWIDNGETRSRLTVTASPLETRPAPDFFVISFEIRDETTSSSMVAPTNGDAAEVAAQLRRVRDELQSTIEELQTSNEEHRASNEEVMSINEELQSTNEELETSKEEMQSLNEELATVNAQLQGKMEELQLTTADLTSLLSSTDIAVLFLDTRFCIRRFTAPLKDLLELIASDVGRPLSDLAMKFVDPGLLSDAQAVLSKLVPIEIEIASNEGRYYLRRITPYRTPDNRIDGVVITFVEITQRKKAEEALQLSEERLADELKAMKGLHELTAKLLAAPGLQSALDELLNAAIGTHAADMGYIQMPDLVAGTLRIVAQRGFDSEFLQKYGTCALADDPAWRRLSRDSARWVIEDVNREPDTKPFRAAAQAAGYRAMQTTPLVTRQGELLGLLSTHFREPHRSSPVELQVTDLYARQAADLMERIRAEEELTRLLHNEQLARQAVDEGARLKDEFLATLSHELRTPLSAVLLWSKMLRGSETDPDRLAEGLRAIEASAEAQARLIEDLLDTSRIASGKMRLLLAETPLAGVVRAAIDTIEPAAEAKGLHITSDLSADVGIVMADPDRLQQVVWNLLANAVKFTPAGGAVRVTLSRTRQNVELRVADTGQGIAPELLPYIFERFRQSEISASGTRGGLGLGLAISKQLVELHGGTIHAESDGPERGATFIVRLPSPPSRRGNSKTKRAGNALISTTFGGARILFVEDDSATRAAVSVALRRAGAEVVDVGSAAAALDSFVSARPDLVLSDIGLPDVDGNELIRRIRRYELEKQAKPVPAVALSAYARESDRHKALEAGFQKHIGKPVSPEMLILALKGLLPAPVTPSPADAASA